jgi:hypothetical protein
MPDNHEEEIVARLEEHGEQQVRLLIASGGWPQSHTPLALK